MDERDRRYDDRWDAGQIAIRQSNEAMNHRLDGMNEIRESMRDASSKFVTGAEVLAIVSSKYASRAEVITIVSAVSGAIGAAVALLTLFLRK